MGCEASKNVDTLGNHPPEERPAAFEASYLCKPLEEWEAQEVSAWYNSLVPDLRKYGGVLLPDEGCIVARWTEQYLVEKGVPATDAMRLIAYRNKAMSRANRASTATTASAAASLPPAAGDGDMEDKAPGSAAHVPEKAVRTGSHHVSRQHSNNDTPSSTVATVTATTTVTTATTTAHSTHLAMYSHKQAVLTKYGATAGADGRRETLMALFTKGVQLVKKGIQHLGPSLPFPGAEAANLVLVLLDLVDSAIANHANLAQLSQRAVAFLDILSAYHEELSNLRPPRYKGVVDDFKELLQGIVAYTRAYTERNCIMRLLTSGSDEEQYQELVSNLATLSEQVAMLVAVDSNARLQQVQKAVDQAAQLLAQAAQYQDPAADARVLVAELGGLETVLADDTKLQQVKRKLDVGSQVTIKMVESLLLSHLDQGPQRLIRHPDLRLFWMKQYASITEVPWFDFWEQFPEQLRDNPADTAMVEELSRMLEDNIARTAFERAVERGNKDCVSVWELRVAFTGDEALLPQVARLLPAAAAATTTTVAADVTPHGAAGSTAGSRGPVAGAPAGPAVPAAGAAAAPAGPMARCQLPPLVSHYTGREEEAAAIVGHLLTRGSLVLLASGGMGKSCLAIDTGWRLMHSGAAPGGALWVDLREAGSKAEVEARFCACLGIQAEKADNTPRILAALRALAAEGNSGADSARQPEQQQQTWRSSRAVARPMHMLMVVDNAEDASYHEETASAFRRLLGKVLHDAPSVRLLVTSRVSLGLDTGNSPPLESASIMEHPVGAIGRVAALQLIKNVASDLSEGEAADVASACNCVPLLLCLVSEALVAGRLTLEDLDRLRASSSSPTGPSTDATGSTVQLVLSSLKKQHQQAAAQLAVFPSAFDEDGAAAVVGLTPPQAHALLTVLHRYSVVQRSSGTQHYVMHMVVRHEAAALGGRIDPGLQARVEGRFVGWVLGLLAEWAAMYHTAQEWKLALAMARDHQADISKLLELLSVPPTGAPHQQGGQGVSQQAQQSVPQEAQQVPGSSRHKQASAACHWDAVTVASTLTDNLRVLLEGLGLLGRMEAPCLALLQRLGAHRKPASPAAAAADLPPPQPAGRCVGDPAAAASAASSSASPPRNTDGEDGNGPQPRQDLQSDQHLELPVASVLHMLAWVRVRGGRLYQEGEEDARRSYELRLAALGPEHPDTLVSQYILAAALGYLRRYSEAEVLNRQVLDLQLRLCGEMHADTAYSINGLAVCVDKQGRFGEAEALYRRALEVRRQVLGERHPATAGSLNNLAGSIAFQGRRQEAEALYRQALELRRAVLGEEHPDTVSTLANLTGCIYDQGRFAEAEPLLRQTLELRRRVLGEDHPDTMQALSSLASCLYEQEDREAEAEALYRQAVRVSVRTLGGAHPLTRSRLVSLRNCVEAQGRPFDGEAALAGLEGGVEGTRV